MMIITVVLLKTIPTLLEGLKVSRGWIQLAFFFALQTLGQSLQDNDNNKRPLGQSYSDDGSKV